MQCYDLKYIEKKDFKEMVRSRGLEPPQRFRH